MIYKKMKLAGEIGFRCCSLESNEIEEAEKLCKTNDHYYLTSDDDGVIWLIWE